MAVTTTTSRVSYVGDGTTTVFAVPFYFLIDPDLNVYIGDTELTTGYTVTGAGNEAGGSVEIIPAPAAGAQVVIVRNPDLLQQTRLPPNDPFPAQAVEDMADKLTMLVQRNGDLIGRALVLADTDVDGSGAYRAKQNRIQDLADPVGSQDSVNLRTMQTAIADLVTTGGGDTVLSLLANNVDPTLGASLVGLIGPDGSPRKVSDLSNGSSTALGDALIPVKQMFVGAIMRTQHDVNAQTISIMDFGAKTNGEDCSASLAAAVAAISLLTNKPALHFPAGTYTYSVSPNWGVNHLRVIADGEVRLRYTGTGDAVIIDAGTDISTGVYDMTFGTPSQPFIIEAPATANNACFVRGVHHSNIAIKPRGANPNRSGLDVRFAVCTNFWVTCSVNEDSGWYLSAQPRYGIYLTSRNTGESVSYCNFHTPIIEGPIVGIYCDGALGNLFSGGTSEGCTSYGVQCTSNSSNNTFFCMDFEANVEDMVISGVRNKFVKCDSAKLVHFVSGALYCELDGGSHNGITFDANANRNLVTGASYNKNGTSSISDSGAYNRYADNFNYYVGINHDAVPRIFDITATGSPFVYVNQLGNPIDFYWQGATVTAFSLTVNGVTRAIPYNQVRIPSGASISLTYSGSPIIWGLVC